MTKEEFWAWRLGVEVFENGGLLIAALDPEVKEVMEEKGGSHLLVPFAQGYTIAQLGAPSVWDFE